jgi:YhcH/YjgK/YiaL family protein
MIAAKLSDWRLYFDGPVWTQAFQFLEKLPVDSPDNDGLVPLDGDTLLYRVMSYPTRGPEGTTVEAHEKYIDIQMSLDGAEAIDWFTRDGLTLQQAYDEENDYVLFQRPESITGTVLNRPGYFAVFYPDDGHTAQQIVDGNPAPVRKVVIKVRLDAVK